ncbi:hypothetical protein FOA43_001630 [Brettanomyces nanus]|uniref:MHD domain-containing protein n=1 Tax=Eeniella nana TaxID=13502 RepID=A0A875S505_EENNA|nr:uncharacterized protein FOA43_001630 [Brettanomyces nanus]QPG74304.1 hypothetical protein FOA43_001630 [Brettanomyces nanus]
MIAALFIFSHKGEVLISRIFRAGVRRNVSEVFRIQVISKLSDIKSPVLTLGSTSFLHIRHGSLWIVAVTRDNADASQVLEFLYKFIDLLRGLILLSEKDDSASDRILTDVDVMNNFSAIYEILGRIIDYGHIQDWDLLELKSGLNAKLTKGHGSKKGGRAQAATSSTIKTGSALLSRAASMSRHRSSSLGGILGVGGASIHSGGANGLYNSRAPGIKYKKNEINITVTEQVSLLMSHAGSIVRAFAEGSVNANTKLSGIPVCSFRLIKQREPIIGKYERENRYEYNEDHGKQEPDFTIDTEDDEEVDDDTNTNKEAFEKLNECNFHNCVNLQDFDNDGIVKFVPPDREFELMRYRTDITSLPFIVYVEYDYAGSDRLDFKLRLKTHYSKTITASDVVVRIPIPTGTMHAKINSDSGKAKLLANESTIQWKFKKLVGQRLCELNAAVDSIEGAMISWSKSRPPISIDFTMDNYSTSGYRIEHLKVDEPNLSYRTVKSVKYFSLSKSYEIRM